MIFPPLTNTVLSAFYFDILKLVSSLGDNKSSEAIKRVMPIQYIYYLCYMNSCEFEIIVFHDLATVSLYFSHSRSFLMVLEFILIFEQTHINLFYAILSVLVLSRAIPSLTSPTALPSNIATVNFV